jgi:two-component system sensor histidine kinase CpxA
MNSLFWKILVSFWLALIIFVGLTLWSSSYYLEKIRTESQSTQPRFKIMTYIKQAQQEYDIHGKKGLRAWLKELDNREAIPYLLVDSDGNDLIGRPVPVRIQQRLNRHKRRLYFEGRDDSEKHNHELPHRKYIITKENNYRLIPDFQSVTLTRILKRPKVVAVPILFTVLISGIVSFLLARYLTAPIGRLRQATRKLAAGDFDQRVSSTMGRRKDEISGLANDFDHMSEQLQRLIASHKQLLRDASHELRSPLARLQVALGLARQRNKGNSTTELDRIERETERLNELIGQLLSLARLESESVQINAETIDLRTLIEGIARDADYEARARNRNIVFNEAEAINIVGDSTLLRSALENIIRNAIRYTEEQTTVEVTLGKKSDNDNFAEVRIRDHGPGIPDDMQDRIFEPFVRTGEARDRESGGYGLGLAIASRAIKLHGGRLMANNEPDKGMSIIVYLPIKDTVINKAKG